MGTYIMLLKYSHEGLKNLKDLPERLDKVRDFIKKEGGELKSYHLTMGKYDAVVIIAAPDDETVAKIVITASVLGNFVCQTLRAFTEKEAVKIVSSLP